MDIHEYQAKAILKKYQIPVPQFFIASNLDEVREGIDKLNLERAVIKIQVHAGGRGKGGGVKLAQNRNAILQFADELIGMRLVNSQTGKKGVVAHEVLISPLIEYKKEYYLAATIDRQKGEAVLIASPAGGMEIEETAKENPDRVKTFPLKNDGKLYGYQLIQLTKLMGWTGEVAEKGKAIALALAKAFVETDGSLAEINPLVETAEGDLLALDAKWSIDENALYRQPEMAAYYDPRQIAPQEMLAKKNELAYVALQGEIGCMVNGAGLAMATMDIIHHCGGRAANFLDVGGSATQEKVAEGFKIILSDPQVKAILVNIFGGIMNCVTLAAGVIAAASELGVSVPLIVRMEGTNVIQGKKMLIDSELNIIIAEDLADAAQKAVDAAKGAH